MLRKHSDHLISRADPGYEQEQGKTAADTTRSVGLREVDMQPEYR
jgi:hypothetical protein